MAAWRYDIYLLVKIKVVSPSGDTKVSVVSPCDHVISSIYFPLNLQALPEYQIAHERAVFKAAAVVSETKRVLKNLDGQGLAELRALQKPDNEIEDLLAAIIIIGTYSPTSKVSDTLGDSIRSSRPN